MKEDKKIISLDLQQMNRTELENEFMKMSIEVAELEAKLKWYHLNAAMCLE